MHKLLLIILYTLLFTFCVILTTNSYVYLDKEQNHLGIETMPEGSLTELSKFVNLSYEPIKATWEPMNMGTNDWRIIAILTYSDANFQN